MFPKRYQNQILVHFSKLPVTATVKGKPPPTRLMPEIWDLGRYFFLIQKTSTIWSLKVFGGKKGTLFFFNPESNFFFLATFFFTFYFIFSEISVFVRFISLLIMNIFQFCQLHLKETGNENKQMKISFLFEKNCQILEE